MDFGVLLETSLCVVACIALGAVAWKDHKNEIRQYFRTRN